MLRAIVLVAAAAPVVVQEAETSIQEAADLLTAGGLASPAGCEYRNVAILVPTIQLGLREVELRAWVKTDRATRQQTVIAWNGLAYKPLRIGDAANLEADATRGGASSSLFFPFDSAEFQSVGAARGPIAAVMLELYGRSDLAEQAAAVRGRTSAFIDDVRAAAGVEFDRVLVDGTAARIVEGLDWEALLMARQAKRFRPMREGTLSALKARTNFPIDSTDVAGLELWISELNKRVAQSRSGTLSLDQIAKLPTEQRITAYTEKLADVRGQRTYYMGEPPPSLDGADKRLLAEGDAGIEALIGAITDTRMTRSLGRGWVLSSNHAFESVSRLAQRTLDGYFNLTGFGGRTNADVQAQYRSHWERARGLPQEEQWLAVLENDALTGSVFMTAAQHLSVPPWVTPAGGGYSFSGGLPPPVTGPPLKWQALKARAGDRAYRALEKWALRSFEIERPPRNPYPFVLAAAVWDAQRAVPLLQRAKAEAIAELARREPTGSSIAQVASCVTALVYAGAPDAWDGYEESLTLLDSAGWSDLDVVTAPLWQHPDDPVSKRIRSKVFSADGNVSPVAALYRPASNFPMLAFLPEYRQVLADALSDTTVVSKGTRATEVTMRYTTPDGRTASSQVTAATTSVPVGGEMDLRMRDLVMDKLGRAMGYSEYHLGLTQGEKDRFVERFRERLLRSDTSWLHSDPSMRPRLPVREPIFPSRAVWG